ncbi:WecB/TagA/CpsF family glycosyltransferase [Bradyrhizobium sp. INPA01-394B]|uniref:WecB/TagA/CpsF family glycosyltransferase n=2 Tax=Bradyrhizobium campsiandrae TaxID=1729892 RepID=A0ABR7UAB7_9BRAD|nr:WecB/TagA/CpsF family glycosyltransferase [Bradyrhizobium campsiandrae]MBC9878312.1 WecB/TagA/CpsF family glycosyltransferase [Bradyrhizobium campsiandrae]MBC9981026.1 WecB/TagA/CpsF family glycosyltransferase [Bradyrhizobium campsiandrae]
MADESAHHREAKRDLYGLLGLPIDAVDFRSLIRAMDTAVAKREPFLISTPNVNFLIKSHQNVAFRDSMLLSDLCLADGMPLIWIAKLLRVPIHERVAGSDLFGRLKSRTDKRLRVFLFGGTGDLAERVGEKLNAEKCGLECVGVLNPGFGSVEELSSPEIIAQINASGADLLAVFLNAEKAQAWLLRNHHRLTVPIRAQFGATINFEAGTIRRAPPLLRSTGFEWLWRIKEEPYLWRRYWKDGRALFQILWSCALPLAITARLTRREAKFAVYPDYNDEGVTLGLAGAATAGNVDSLLPFVRQAVIDNKCIKIDLASVEHMDGRFFGVLMAVRRQLARRDLSLTIAGVSPRLRRIFRLNRFEFLLADR